MYFPKINPAVEPIVVANKSPSASSYPIYPPAAVEVSSAKLFLLISFSGVVVPGTLFYIAASKVPAGILSISVAFVPMLTYVCSLYLKKHYKTLYLFNNFAKT